MLWAGIVANPESLETPSSHRDLKFPSVPEWRLKLRSRTESSNLRRKPWCHLEIVWACLVKKLDLMKELSGHLRAMWSIWVCMRVVESVAGHGSFASFFGTQGSPGLFKGVPAIQGKGSMEAQKRPGGI